MANQSLPSIAALRQLLRHDAEAGLLFWREKSEDSIASARQSTRQRIARNWNARYAGKPAFTTVAARGYFVGTVDLRHYYAHRVIWALHYGEWPHDVIDHINGNPLDNRIANLRCVSQSQNLQNQKLHGRNRTGHHGVWYDKNRDAYQVYITQEGKRLRLGRHKDLDEAIATRKAAELRLGFHPNHGRAKTIPSVA